MITVVGGLYDEICHEPRVRRTMGSGVRAARTLGDDVGRLVTVADGDSADLVRPLLAGISLEVAQRSAPVAFTYDTPLSRPILDASTSDLLVRPPNVHAEDVLVFGMLERNPVVDCRRAVVDPQHSLGIDRIGELVRADELIVVANHREVRSMADGSDTVDAARSMLKRLGAVAVVVKCGAIGALVVSASGVTGVAVLQTASVFPIGSGDVFSAALAAAWFAGVPLDDATRVAAARTAGYCATRQLGIVTIDTTPGLVPSGASVADPPLIYLASSFATPQQRWGCRTLTRGLEDIGASVFAPLRDVGEVVDQATTAAADLDGVRACDAMLVVADSARSGPHFEAGWASQMGKPVVVVSSDTEPHRFTMLRGTGAEVLHDWSSAAYRVAWAGLRHRASAAGS